MSSSFSYPKSRHRREQTPPAFNSYRAYKPFLRHEFSGLCVYCRSPDTMLGQAAFGVDHYRPKSKYPELSAEYTNLFYCCNTCNRNKGNYWPAGDEADKHFIPNPVTHSMFAHLRYKHGTVEPVSDAGAFSVEYLDLNEPAAIIWREDLLHSIDVLEDKLSDLAAAVRAIRAARAASKISDAECIEKLAVVESLSIKSKRALDRFCGVFD